MKSKKGFTLIELTLAIAFISILLITIGVVTVDIISVYRKGVAMKAVNSTGLDLINEFSRSISEAPSVDYAALCGQVYDDNSKKEQCKIDNAYRIIYQEYKTPDMIKINNKDDSKAPVPVAGAFCDGKDSFLWNTGYVNNLSIYTNADGSSISGAKLTYRTIIDPANEKNNDTFRLLKISDPNRELCINRINPDYNYNNNGTGMYRDKDANDEWVFQMTSVLKEEPLELLPTTNSAVGLALYSFVVYPQTKNPSGETFNPASMILATIAGGVDITKSGDYCTVPTDVFSDFNYCAINKFNFAMRSTGE